MLQRRSYDVKCLLSPELLVSENQGSPRATLLVFGFLGGRRVTTSGERETKYFLPLFKITIGFKPRKFNDENCEDALRAAESTNVKYISQTLKKIEIVLWPTDLIFFFYAELPLGAHRHTDDGVHGGDDERGEGDVLHRQIYVRRAVTQRGPPPGAALRHRGRHCHLDQQGAHRRALMHVLNHMGDVSKHFQAFNREHTQLCFCLER